MKKLIHICFMLCAALSAVAQEQQEKVLHVYDWKDLMSQHPFPNSEIVSMDGMSVLKIQNTNNAPLEISLLTITNTSLIKKTDTISWDMKYDGVQNAEHWRTNHFGWAISSSISGTISLITHIPPSASGGDERTNEESYDLFKSENWKRQDFLVDNQEIEGLPTKLDLKLFLPGAGTVYLRPLKLIGIKSDWWSPQMSGLIGGTAGALLGCLGGLLGLLAAVGKARGFVLTMTKMLIALGMLMAIAGILAVASSQPYAVWYPLVLTGGILTFVFSVNLYPIKKRYDDLEIRRMASMDATGH
jgi:hypothetical protein